MKIKNYKDYSVFFWLILVILVGIIISTINKKNKEEQSLQIEGALENIYLKKTVKEITKNLQPRYETINYISKSGDTYQSIINQLNINPKEKGELLSAIKKVKSLKILRINQKFTFKFDYLSEFKIVDFKIETDKKNEVFFSKAGKDKKFIKNRITKIFLID